MTGYDEFIAVFGKITLFDIVQLLLAGVFLLLAYRKLKKYLVDKHDRDLFKEYEDAGGNGYIHTVVQPAMNLLKVIDIEDAASVLRLTDSRK